MSDPETNLLMPIDRRNSVINRSMGVPIPTPVNFKLGSNVSYVDIFDLSLDLPRVYTGLSILNPSSSSRVVVGIGDAFNIERSIVVDTQQYFTFDQLTFGPGITSDQTDKKLTHVRALLDIAQGTFALATIGYGGSGQPTDTMTIDINGKVYEFSDDESKDPVNSDFIVAIGVDADATYTNLMNKINLVEQALTATIDTGADVLTLTSNYGGDYGDGLVIADGSNPTGAAFSGNTAGGVGGVDPIFHIW